MSFYRYSDLPERYVPPANERPDEEYRPPLPPKQVPQLAVELPFRPPRPQAPVPCCICDRKNVKSWKCVQCDDSFCDDCWPTQRPHRPGKVGIDGRGHEKVDDEVIFRLTRVFEQPTREEQHQRHGNDINTTWFGVVKEFNQPYLHYSNRLVDILQESQTGVYSERFPQLVSFVGQTGAGKSTVIKMLMNKQQARTQDTKDYQAPVPGLVGDNIPTTGDVHLYADPGTYDALKPILYADCEGMTGGENTPRGLTSRDKIEGVKKPKQFVKNKLRKKLDWATNPSTQSREFAVTSLFPRILYTFSDVVVFVLREVRTFQTEVLKQLVEWAATSIDKSINQPSLPHIVIVINATEASIDERQWNTDIATEALLGDYRNSVRQVPKLQEVVAAQAVQGNEIHTTKDLLKLYYSSVSVVRIPSKGRYMKIDDQIGELYQVISSKCAESYAYKENIRMLLNAERLPQYVNAAYEHFSRYLDEPFDFMKEARRHTPLPRDFGGHILNLIISIYNTTPSWQNSDAKALFERLSRPIASCVMLAATRDNVQGTYSSLLRDTYRQPLKTAFTEFCERWLRCSFSRGGLRCINAKSSHEKGHQAASGKMLARGAYWSRFDPDELFQSWIDDIDRNIQTLDTRLRRMGRRDEKYKLPNIHKVVMADFYSRAGPPVKNLKSHVTCLCCVRRIPDNVLPCGHILCKACIQCFGRSADQGAFELDNCPLHPEETPWLSPARIRFKPKEAGVRVLCLDGGGVRGIIELVILEAIERELGGHIPIQNFFDLIVGTSTGGIIALGMGVKRWRVHDCITRFKNICGDAFTSRVHRSIKAITIVSRKSYYKTRPLEEALQMSFGPQALLYGGPKHESSTSIRVAVTSTHAIEGTAVVLSNYNTEGERNNVPYKFVRPQDPTRELKIWEAARATSAAPPYFKAFFQAETREAYTDGAIHHNCPALVAESERRLLWEDVSDWPPDILLSLGTGLGKTETPVQSPDALSPGSGDPRSRSVYRRQRNINGLGLMWWAANTIIDQQLNCEEQWKTHCANSTPPGKSHTAEDRRRNLRINIRFPGSRPSLDDVRELETMHRHADESIDEDPQLYADIREAAHRLVASCFYFERASPVYLDRDTGLYTCVGCIRCRFVEGSRDLKGLGYVLRGCIRGRDFEPAFFLEENYGSPDEKLHEVPIPDKTIADMCDYGVFQLPSPLRVESVHQSSVTRLSLCLQRSWYTGGSSLGSIRPLLSISGFPRELWVQEGALTPGAKDEAEAESDFKVAVELAQAETSGTVPVSPSEGSGKLQEKVTRFFSFASSSKAARVNSDAPGIARSVSTGSRTSNRGDMGASSTDLHRCASTSHSTLTVNSAELRFPREPTSRDKEKWPEVQGNEEVYELG